MSADIEQRKLAAIMFTDMVGYSALSQRDGKVAMELLEEHRALLRGIFPRFKGTEIKTIGDAFLVEFGSALEAAQCAIEIQRALAKRDADAPANRQIQVRIGIHIGDVIHRAGDVYGDGVNIASRIEPLASPGGICLSMDVERQIRNAVETRFEKLAPTELKNISVPMDLFRIVLPWEHGGEDRSEIRSGERQGNEDRKSWKPGPLLVAIAIIVVGLLGYQALRSRNAAAPPSNASVPRTGAATVVSEKSIAVLPFENLSSDKENAYFTEGIQDEILTRLSKIGDLKVISRTSTQKYKSAPDNLHEIGNQLGVAHLVEGSVQKIANAVHVNVQLIRAATDEHVWAESYNRKLEDVFGVQGEIATAIAEQLKAKLTGAEQKAVNDKPTQNAQAYDSFLRGVAFDGHLSTENAAKAVNEYANAVQIDPAFALAWARLAVARSYLYFNGVDLGKNSASAVKEAADRAMALQPELGESFLAQGVYRYRVLRDFPAALQSYQEALKRLPGSSLVLEQMGHLERRLGQLEDAKKHFEMAAQLDPRNLDIVNTLAGLLADVRRFKESEEMFDRVLLIAPDNTDALGGKAFLFQGEGLLDKSAAMLGRIPANSEDPNVVLGRALQFYYERKFDAAINLVLTSPSPVVKDPRTVTFLGQCQSHAGRKDDARATFLRAIAMIKPSSDADAPVDARDLPAFLAWCNAGLGEKNKALEEAQKAVTIYQNDVSAKPFAESVQAQVQAQFGEIDAAIATITRLLDVPGGLTRGTLRVDPAWDPLRNDARFQKLCQEPD